MRVMMMKGQIFTFDVLVAFVAIVAVVGFVSWQIEQVHVRTAEMSNEAMYFMCQDILQAGVKSELASYDGYARPNFINVSETSFGDRFSLYNITIASMLNNTYAGSFIYKNAELNYSNGCANKNNIVVCRRPVLLFNGTGMESDWLTMKVCAK